METKDLDKLFEDKNISQSSKTLYLKNLERLNGGVLKNFNFLKDIDKVMEKIQKYKPNTQRTYIISIVSLLKSLTAIQPKKYKKLYDKYYPYLETLNKDLKSNIEKTDKEKENWIDQDAVMSKLKELKDKVNPTAKKLNETQYQDLLNYLLLSLYTLQPPRRNADYQNALITKNPDFKNLECFKDYNWVDLNDNKFVFTKFKTSKTYQNQEVGISPELREVIDLYLKHHPLRKLLTKKTQIPFIVNYNGEPYTNNNDFTRLLYRIFDKKIGASMLRKIFLTSKYSDTMDNLKKDTNDMGTSTSTAENHYIKE